MKNVIDRKKRNKTLSEIKLVENINKNPQSFLEIGHAQNKVIPSHKLQDHAYQLRNPFRLKEDNPSQNMPESIDSCKFVLCSAF